MSAYEEAPHVWEMLFAEQEHEDALPQRLSKRAPLPGGSRDGPSEPRPGRRG